MKRCTTMSIQLQHARLGSLTTTEQQDSSCKLRSQRQLTVFGDHVLLYGCGNLSGMPASVTGWPSLFLNSKPGSICCVTLLTVSHPSSEKRPGWVIQVSRFMSQYTQYLTVLRWHWIWMMNGNTGPNGWVQKCNYLCSKRPTVESLNTTVTREELMLLSVRVRFWYEVGCCRWRNMLLKYPDHAVQAFL